MNCVVTRFYIFNCNYSVVSFMVMLSPSGTVQGAVIGRSQMINCIVDTTGGVESSLVMIGWMGPRGGNIMNDSRVTINPTASSGNTYTSSLQFTYLMEEDEGTYTCNVMILETRRTQSVELRPRCESFISFN